MKKRFEPVEGRNFDIIEAVVNSDEVKNLPEDLVFKIRLCVEEVEENILNYSGTTWIDIETDIKDGVLSISFRDGGVEFDPLAKEDPDITSSLEDRQVGGLGIFLCKKMMTSLDYHFENGCNVFIMRLNV
ncbi:MAG: ATP-binding protein [Bacteroidales bacterium]|nr:ATP-binding protein [Bacteroidales bacterium]